MAKQPKQASQTPQAGSTTSPKMHKWAKWPDELIHRSMINLAPYNPRFMTDEHRANLEDGLATHGAVQPLVWNRRTGTLVGGHQRLTYYDKQEYPNTDYSITCVVVDIDDAAEKALNLALNNLYAQGSYNIDLLGQSLKRVGLKGTGFNAKNVKLFVSPTDIDAIFGTHHVEPETPQASTPALQTQPAPSHQLVVTLVFQNRANCDRLSTLLGFDPNDRYIDGKRFLAVVEPMLRS